LLQITAAFITTFITPPMNIDRILKQKGITKKALAENIGMSRENLHRILSGNPTLSNIEKIAAVLDIPLWQLFAEISETVEGEIHYKGRSFYFKNEHELIQTLEKLRKIMPN
jgi:transcriptional regulator with XRE-family HTH domain